MPNRPPLLCLPLMHKDLGLTLPDAFAAQKVLFWPGLPLQAKEDSAQNFMAQSFPFSPQEAAACLKDIQSMGEAALSGVPLQALLAPQRSRAQLQEIQEQEDLESFIQTGQEPAPQSEASIHELRQGQKFLLWAWLMEEHLLEVQRLTENYTFSAAQLTSALEVEKDEALAGLEQIQNMLSSDTFALPPWHLTLENMALFLEDESSALINHPQMIEYIMENAQQLHVQPISAQNKERLGLGNYEGQECTASFADLLQKDSAKFPAPWLKKRLHCIIIKESACLLH